MIYFLSALYFFLIFENVFRFITYLNFWDEITLFIVLFFTLTRRRKIQIEKKKGKIIQLILLVIIVGIIGNLLHPNIQNHKSVIVKDIISFFKFPILLLCLLNTMREWPKSKRNKLLEFCNYISKAAIIAELMFAIIGYLVPLGVYSNDTRFLKSYRFFFSHETYLVASLVFCISMLILEDKKKNIVYVYLACVLLFLTQRYKGFAMIAIIILLINVQDNTLKRIIEYNWKSSVKIRLVLPIASIICIILYSVFISKFRMYLKWGMTSARIALYTTAVKIASNYFPIGSGFGTFASYLSGKYYSNIYYMYGISRIEGLRVDNYRFISDAFWPGVLGQFGVLGAILYSLIIIKLIKLNYSYITENNKMLSVTLLWIYAIIASFMETYFSNTTGVTFALILTLYIGIDYRDSDKNLIQQRQESNH